MWGGRAAVPKIPGLDGHRLISPTARWWTSISCRSICWWWAASYIGLEFGQMYRRFGQARSRVAEDGTAPCGRAKDEDVSEGLAAFLNPPKASISA